MLGFLFQIEYQFCRIFQTDSILHFDLPGAVFQDDGRVAGVVSSLRGNKMTQSDVLEREKRFDV